MAVVCWLVFKHIWFGLFAVGCVSVLCCRLFVCLLLLFSLWCLFLFVLCVVGVLLGAVARCVYLIWLCVLCVLLLGVLLLLFCCWCVVEMSRFFCYCVVCLCCVVA